MKNGYKYKTLADLVAAYKSGELSRDDYLVIDNDSTTVYVPREQGELLTSEKVFDGGGPSELIEQALDLLGVPWENA